MNDAQHIATVFQQIYAAHAPQYGKSAGYWLEKLPAEERVLLKAAFQGLLDLGIIHPASGCHYSLGRLEVAEGQIARLEQDRDDEKRMHLLHLNQCGEHLRSIAKLKEIRDYQYRQMIEYREERDRWEGQCRQVQKQRDIQTEHVKELETLLREAYAEIEALQQGR